MKTASLRCRGTSAALPTPYRLGPVDFPALEALCLA